MADQFKPKKPSVDGYFYLQDFLRFVESKQTVPARKIVLPMVAPLEYQKMEERSKKRNA